MQTAKRKRQLSELRESRKVATTLIKAILKAAIRENAPRTAERRNLKITDKDKLSHITKVSGKGRE